MRSIEEALIAFFEQVARQDKVLLEILTREQSFSVGPGRWNFALPDLFSFLQRRDANFCTIDYKAFRQILFDCPINQTTRLHGAEIVIAENRAKVDRSRYAMVWRAH